MKKQLMIIGVIITLVCVELSGCNSFNNSQFINRNYIHVGGSGPENNTTIQSAVDFANDGATIFIHNGNYTRNVQINKNLTFVGESRENTIINVGKLNISYWENDSGAYVQYRVNISNLNLKKGGIEGFNTATHCNFNNYNVYVFGYNDYDYINPHTKIVDCIFNNGSIGLDYHNYGLIQNCSLYSCRINLDEGGRAHIKNCRCYLSNIHIYGGFGFIENCFFYDAGISGSTGISISVRNSTFCGGDVSMYPGENGMGCLSLKNCTIYNSSGVTVGDEVSFGMSECKIYNTEGIILSNPFSYGIDNCYIYNNSNGIIIDYFSSEASSLITNCNIYNNSNYGIKLGGSGNISIYNNNFVNNGQNAYDADNISWYRWKSNYWSDYNGTDENNDGYGDTPYNIAGGSCQDLYPLTYPFQYYDEAVDIPLNGWQINNTTNLDKNKFIGAWNGGYWDRPLPDGVIGGNFISITFLSNGTYHGTIDFFKNDNETWDIKDGKLILTGGTNLTVAFTYRFYDIKKGNPPTEGLGVVLTSTTGNISMSLLKQ
jgi:hypothetical protein